MRPILLLAAVLLTTLGPLSGTSAQHTRASEIAPAGHLRVGFQVGSPILAKRAPDGAVTGIVVDLGMYIAEHLGAAYEPVVYANQEAYAQSFGKGEWDIAIGVRSTMALERSEVGPDFMVADAKYIAAPGRVFEDSSRVDEPGVRVGVSRGGGSDQFLSRALKSAQVVRVPGGVANATEALRTGTVDVWAANPVTLGEIEGALHGAKVVPGAWTTGRYAVSLPTGRSAMAQRELAQIVSDAKRTGVVTKAIERAGFKGVGVAPD